LIDLDRTFMIIKTIRRFGFKTAVLILMSTQAAAGGRTARALVSQHLPGSVQDRRAGETILGSEPREARGGFVAAPERTSTSDHDE
jgi:hypothetical protein